MRGRKLLTAALALVCLLFLMGAAPARQSPELGYSVIVASDLHYLASELTDHGAYFRAVMANGDGKVTEYCDEITDAFLAEVIEARPEALILTGDLSFNGERASHVALEKKFQAVEDAGIPVFVLPGNHDVYRGTAAAFFGDAYELVPSVTSEEFREIYFSFGFDEALSADEDSLSYVARLNGHTWLLMLDANTIRSYCSLSGKTLNWAEEQLRLAKEQGVQVLVACHQNLFQHSMFRISYVLECAEELHELMERYEIPLMLSGHMHIQHIQTEGTVTEIASSSLTMAACQYGILQSEGESFRYRTRSVDLESWAKTQGLEEGALPSFPDYALKSLDRRTREQALQMLTNMEYSDEERQMLAEYACALNRAYFTGDLTAVPDADPDGALQAEWEGNGSLFSSYFASIKPEIGKNYCVWER